MKKRRSDISKLVSAARNVWRQSEVYQDIKKGAKSRPGWFICCSCKKEREVIKVDHIEAIGAQPQSLGEFGTWLERLFCSKSNLQSLCNDCHKIKTKLDAKKLRSKRHDEI